MKTHIHRIDVTCDRCGKLSTDTHELVFSLGRKAWASDICPKCEPAVLEYMTKLGMGGPQARKLPGTPTTSNGPAQPVVAAVRKAAAKHAKNGPSKPAKAKRCDGCGESFKTPSGRRRHNTTRGCGDPTR